MTRRALLATITAAFVGRKVAPAVSPGTATISLGNSTHPPLIFWPPPLWRATYDVMRHCWIVREATDPPGADGFIVSDEMLADQPRMVPLFMRIAISSAAPRLALTLAATA